MGRGDTFHFYQYVSDDGNFYFLKLSDAVADAGGFSTQVDPRSARAWGFGPKNIRHVYGKSTTGKRDRLPIATADNALYVSGGNFSLGGTSYAVEGAIGEARKFNAVA